jgi:hypothetical protein
MERWIDIDFNSDSTLRPNRNPATASLSITPQRRHKSEAASEPLSELAWRIAARELRLSFAVYNIKT